jgi:hypothetical protein
MKEQTKGIIKNKNLKTIKIIHEEVKGSQLKDLLIYVSKISNIISLAREFNGELTNKEFNEIQNEYKMHILEEDKKRQLYTIRKTLMDIKTDCAHH